MGKELKIEAKPYEFVYDPEKIALIIIDMQKDFCYMGGFGEKLGNDMTYIQDPIEPVKNLLEKFREKDLPVIHTREGHRPDLTDCTPTKLRRSKHKGAGIGDQGPMGRILVRGEEGHEIIDELKPKSGEPVIDKPGKGAFYQTDLNLILRNKSIESLIVTGVTTHVCVESTIREANDRGYEALLVEDGTSAYDPDDKEKTLQTIPQQGGIFGWVSNSEKVLDSIKNI